MRAAKSFLLRAPEGPSKLLRGSPGVVKTILSLVTCQELLELDWKVMIHTSYSLYLVLLNYYLFGSL